MANQQAHIIMQHTVWPVVTIAFALIVYLYPDFSSVLVYDRPAILSGELWRLISCHWVHFSKSHLFYNLSVLVITGLAIRYFGYRFLSLLFLLASVVISITMLVLLPEMTFYGGLSGIAVATTVYLSLSWLNESPPWNRAGILALTLLCSKLVIDASVDQFSFAKFDDFIVPMHLSHLVGAICGLIVFLWSTTKQSPLFSK
jgi:rhomboid family GlyGly-CTERM serine protease